MAQALPEQSGRPIDSTTDTVVDRLAMLLLQQMLSELARTYRTEGATAARLMLGNIECVIAERLYLMCDISLTLRTGRDVIRAVALRVRAELRGERGDR
ncbi:hypothetical protein U8607_21290 [Methylobacterium durans]|uniref:hypothetical protein n=1 Tax=Methylobacterium durans TaxID=2202825 RepID=UPI002B00142D|nr:hypothetical protein [Methylobacterium durans]MEA1834631.1 hypothetical protein [Methylobacterium durans]